MIVPAIDKQNMNSTSRASGDFTGSDIFKNPPCR
jgi:hypothetical protein